MDQDVADVIAPRPAMGLARLTDRARPWELAGLCLGIVFAVFITLYWRAAAGAVQVWYDSRAYNHGFLVLPIVGYLIWERRPLLAGLAAKPFPLALLLLVPAGAVWLVADIVGVLEGQQLALYISIQAILLAVLGREVYAVLRFPFLYLFFLIPTGEFLTPYLQDFTARFVVIGLNLTGIPVYSDGVFLQIPNGQFEVAEACAGLRFLTATLAFGLLFADFAYDKLSKKLAFYALCVVTPIIANGFRAYGMVMIAHLTNNEYAVGFDHLVYGWVFFSIVTLALAALGMTFRDPPRELPAPPTDIVHGAEPRSIVVVALAALVLLAAPRAYAGYLEARPARLAGELALPQIGAPWQRVTVARPAWLPELPGADVSLLGSWQQGGTQVDVYIGYFAKQGHQKKLVGNDAHIPNPQGWTAAGWTNTSLTIAGERVPVTATRVASNRGTKRLVLSWYWIDDRFEQRGIVAKLLQAKAELVDHVPQAAAIAISTEMVDDSVDATLARLGDFVSHIEGGVRPVLERAAHR